MASPEEHKFRYLHLAEEVRAKILAGVYPVGGQIETVETMMARYAAARSTVSQAMQLLEKEGLITRGRGRGTFVADRTASGEVAIVLTAESFGTNASPAFAVCVGALMKGTPEHPVRWKSRLHVGRESQIGQPPAGLDLLSEPVLRDLRGVLTFHPLFQIGEVLKSRRIPVVLMNDQDCGTATQVIWYDVDAAYRQIMAHLKEVGCRTVGGIWGVALDRINMPGGALDRFKTAATAAGLHTDPRWLVSQPPGWGNQPRSERGGWELFQEFWSRSGPRPDALFCGDEQDCRGVLRAAANLNIQVGADIKLITMATKGLDLPISIPVTRMDFSMFDLASAAISAMEAMIGGVLPAQRKLWVPTRLIRGQTT